MKLPGKGYCSPGLCIPGTHHCSWHWKYMREHGWFTRQFTQILTMTLYAIKKKGDLERFTHLPQISQLPSGAKNINPPFLMTTSFLCINICGMDNQFWSWLTLCCRELSGGWWNVATSGHLASLLFFSEIWVFWVLILDWYRRQWLVAALAVLKNWVIQLCDPGLSLLCQKDLSLNPGSSTY